MSDWWACGHSTVSESCYTCLRAERDAALLQVRELTQDKSKLLGHYSTVEVAVTAREAINQQVRDLTESKAYWQRQTENQLNRFKEAHKAWEDANRQIDALKLENTVLLKDKQYGPTDRLLSWVEAVEGRKPPSQAFTAGPERRIADLWLMLEKEADDANRQVSEAMKACIWATHDRDHTEPKHCVASLASLIELRDIERRGAEKREHAMSVWPQYGTPCGLEWGNSEGQAGRCDLAKGHIGPCGTSTEVGP